MIASEPLTFEQKDWMEVKNNTMVVITPKVGRRGKGMNGQLTDWNCSCCGIISTVTIICLVGYGFVDERPSNPDHGEPSISHTFLIEEAF